MRLVLARDFKSGMDEKVQERSSASGSGMFLRDFGTTQAENNLDRRDTTSFS